MKKIFYTTTIFLILILTFNNTMAAPNEKNAVNPDSECSGLLINTSYSTINAPANNIYAVGDIVDTNLSFELDGDDGQSISPLSIVLVMDRSGSMNETMGGKVKIEVAKEALTGTKDKFGLNDLTDGITDGIYDLNTPDVKLSFVSFNNSPTIDWPAVGLAPINLETKRESLEKAINDMYAGGGTYMGAAVSSAVDILLDYGDSDSKKVVIVASDGISADNVYNYANNYALKNEVIGYAIGIGNRYNKGQLLDITNQDEDRFYDANNASQLNSALEKIMEEIVTFQASDLKVSFNITDLANSNLSLVSSNPPYSSISPDGKVLTWNLGNRTAGYIKNINLKFKVDSAIAGALPLNEDVLNFSYNTVDENGAAVTCSSEGGGLSQPAVPVVKIFTHEVPTILNFWSNPANGSTISEGDSLTLSWQTKNAEKCKSSSDDGVSNWNGDEIAAEGTTENKTINPIYTGNAWNRYWLQCEKFYDFGGGATKTVYSAKEQVQVKVNPCSPSYSCDWDSLQSACSSSTCGSPVTLNSTCHLVNACGLGSCSDATPPFVCAPKSGVCPPCKEVEEWIEVAP